MFTRQTIFDHLTNVLDPELGISIVDLGLVYNVDIKGSDVEILMTLTTIGCPLFGTIQEMVEKELKQIEGMGEIRIELTFDPPWDSSRMSKETQVVLGFA